MPKDTVEVDEILDATTTHSLVGAFGKGENKEIIFVFFHSDCEHLYRVYDQKKLVSEHYTLEDAINAYNKL
jgi:hypothetical protein